MLRLHLQLELSAKQREAELNAEKLSLESQIHWLTEENQRLQQQQAAGAPAAAAPAAPPPELQERIANLESELRRAKRGEMKLQALLYRLRKDVDSAGGPAAAAAAGSVGGAVFDNLRDVRSLQYDVDMLTEKCKVRWGTDFGGLHWLERMDAAARGRGVGEPGTRLGLDHICERACVRACLRYSATLEDLVSPGQGEPQGLGEA